MKAHVFRRASSVCLLAISAVVCLSCGSPAGSGGTDSGSTTRALSQAAANSEGFGASTPGGSGQPVYHVTNLDDSGAGSFRDAVSQGNRNVVFDVAGTIRLQSALPINGSFITIDGLSAPPPGITLYGNGLVISTAHDVIVRGIRVRNAALSGAKDSIHVGSSGAPGQAYNMLIDHVSVDGCGDGNIDVTYYAHDVTVSWSILSNCAKNMLIKYWPQRVTLHHNVFVDSRWRTPWISYTDKTTPNLSPDTEVDMRNNLIWHWGDSGGGTGVECGAKVNLVNNFYSSPNTSLSRQKKAIMVHNTCRIGVGAHVYTSGNYDPDPLPFDINSAGNQSAPFPAAPVSTTDACTAAQQTLVEAGAPPLDSVDQRHLVGISLPSSCN